MESRAPLWASYEPARYLLRFDDLCPTQSRSGWEPYEQLIAEFRLKPILAVVPDNQDPALELDLPDAGFWARMRALEAAGADIALHGYRHLCASRGRGLVRLHRETEFAGVAEGTQRAWIAAGLAVLRGHGLNPRVWVAPRHGFDRATLAALRSEGVPAVSDGFARLPCVRRGLCWIPQQLWEPVEKRRGLWTICLHANTAGPRVAVQLRAFLEKNAERFTSVDEVLARAEDGLNLLERVYAAAALARVRARSMWKNMNFLTGQQNLG